MDVDYIKLAEANKIVLLCQEKLFSMRKNAKKKLLLNKYHVGYRYGFFYCIKFLKENQDIAEKMLGKFYKQHKDNMLYAEKVESFLINQFTPAVYHEMGKNKVRVDDMPDVFQFCLEGIRNSVWRYTKSDIKFTTFAINGIRNNISIFRKRKSKEIYESKWRNISFFSDCQSTKINQPFEDEIADHRINESTVTILDFIKSIALQAQITDKQMFELSNYVAAKKQKHTDFKIFNAAKRRIVKFIGDNPQVIPDLERIVG